MRDKNTYPADFFCEPDTVQRPRSVFLKPISDN